MSGKKTPDYIFRLKLFAHCIVPNKNSKMEWKDGRVKVNIFAGIAANLGAFTVNSLMTL